MLLFFIECCWLLIDNHFQDLIRSGRIFLISEYPRTDIVFPAASFTPPQTLTVPTSISLTYFSALVCSLILSSSTYIFCNSNWGLWAGFSNGDTIFIFIIASSNCFLTGLFLSTGDYLLSFMTSENLIRDTFSFKSTFLRLEFYFKRLCTGALLNA